MSTSSRSFREWMVHEIENVLGQQTSPPPFLIWCDPHDEWRALLRDAGASSGFELWAPKSFIEADHELLVRDRFFSNERKPRVVWLPVARDEISWFKVFELDAQMVWEKDLLQGVRDYGVHIPREHENELSALLPAYAGKWFNEPISSWKELTPGGIKGTLVDEHRLLQVLVGEKGEFSQLKEEDRFTIFACRATEEFGLPDPTGMDETDWRIAATACLLATEAAQGSPENPPTEGDRIIPAGLIRDRALRFLKSWRSHIQYIPSFEALVQKADTTLGLTYWAKNLKNSPRSYCSRAVERTLFEQISEQLDRIEEVDTLAVELESRFQGIKERQQEFWGTIANEKVGWSYLVQLADAASLLVESVGTEESWKTAMDGVHWFSDRGWHLDQAGEWLFLELPDMPGGLHRIRARLRRGYLRAVDRINRVFSNLLHNNWDDISGLPTSGEVLMTALDEGAPSTAVFFLDACRLDLGYRLAHLLNLGEPVKRASVQVARAPIPSITALGMPFALPIKRELLCVTLAGEKNNFCVKAQGFSGDLALAQERRKWLEKHVGARKFLTLADVLDSDKLKSPGRTKTILIIHGDTFDMEGHEGQLKLEGAEEHLERYARAVRRLQSIGYKRIILATDHGFFHWQPKADEVENKPSGELLWKSRRAIVGQDMMHPNAIRMPVMGSEMEVMVPRSINAFRTYGGLGYFHGGATLQEMIVPVIVANWPAKAEKIDVVLKPLGHISSEAPRIEIQAGSKGQAKLFADVNQLSRRVLVKVKELSTGKLIFRHKEAVAVEPEGETMAISLQLVDPKPAVAYGTPLMVEVLDADNEEMLDREEITLKVDIDEW